MPKALEVVLRMLWEFKWWWMIPLGLMVGLFALIAISANITRDAPFMYTLF